MLVFCEFSYTKNKDDEKENTNNMMVYNPNNDLKTSFLLTLI